MRILTKSDATVTLSWLTSLNLMQASTQGTFATCLHQATSFIQLEQSSQSKVAGHSVVQRHSVEEMPTLKGLLKT